MCLSVHGCEVVNGGAVELSWKLRPASSSLEDKFVGCSNPSLPGTGTVLDMRLDWEVRVQADVHTGSARWLCSDSHGVTGFDLPEGYALLSVTPICEDGEPAEPASYIAPAAEQRRVIVGDTINLGAVEIIVNVTSCESQSCICDRIALGHTARR
jgi:hypothetical protein